MTTAAVLPAAAPLLSVAWFRIATLKPLLDMHLRSDRQVLRGEVWHTLVRADGSRGMRLNHAAWQAVARCDGQRSVQAVWEITLALLGDDAPTQDEFFDLLVRLHGAGSLSFDHKPDFGAAPGGAALDDDATPTSRRQHLLAWRVPLGNPDAMLARWVPRLRGLFTSAALLLWLLLVGIAALAGLAHAEPLAAQLQLSLSGPLAWGLAWLAYPLIKALHEAAHGLAARQAGATVAEWGVTLLMFVPVPYVDASAASALPQRRSRLVVAAAGIVVELGIAAVALGVALQVQPGALREAALLVFFIAALSTLLVNANPLLRFDGYHMLCDALALPNLASRSTRHWLHQLRRLLLRLPAANPVPPARGESAWLWAYAPLALVMRWTIAIAVIQWTASISMLLGLILVGVFGWMLAAKPLLAWLRWLHRAPMPDRERRRARGRSVFVGVSLVLPLVLCPLPDATVVQGVLWLPEKALVRTQVAGFVDAVMVVDGQAVHAGDSVLRLHAPGLQADVDRLRGRVEALLAEQAQTLRDDPARAVGAAHGLLAARAELAQLEERMQQLDVRAQADGHITVARAADLPGRYLQRGDLVAQVLSGDAGIVQLAIPQDQVARVGAYRGRVEVRAADAAAPVLHGHWAGTSAGGGAALPSAALGQPAGGRLAVDPADRSGLRPAQAVVRGDVQLETPAAASIGAQVAEVTGQPIGQHIGQRIGERMLVRFEHGRAPLAWQAARGLQQQLLRHFNPAQ